MRYFILTILACALLACGGNNTDEAKAYNTNLSQEEIVSKGAELFQSNCRVCHSLDKNTPSGMAPVLENVKAHWPHESELMAYIKNAPEQMQETERARKIYQDWKNKAQMPAFTALSLDEIHCITKFLYKKTQ